MADTIFYTAVTGSVTQKLDLRKTYYKSEDRSSGAHKWLFQKMAWARAEAQNSSTGKRRSLEPSRIGGLGAAGVTNSGLYKNSAIPTSIYDETAGRFIPRPHINSVKVSNEGDFGSLKKAEVSFTVYSLSDLNLCQPFFDLGANLIIEYGWNDAGGAGGLNGKFNGVIYNFSYSVNSGGGFDCISYGMSAGINTLTGDVKASSDSNGKKVVDAAGNTVEASTIIGEIDVLVLNASGLASNAINSDGIGAVALPTTWGSYEQRELGVDVETTKPQYYISLEKLVQLVNEKVLRGAGGTKFNNLAIQCNGNVTKCNVPGKDKLVSGNPIQVLFPGYGNYGSILPTTLQPLMGNGQLGVIDLFPNDFATEIQNGDLSKAMINTEWLKQMLKNMGTLTADAQKSVNKSVGKFLQNVLDMIHINSGTRFKLSLVSNPKNESEIIITDANYVEERVVPYEITAVTEDSICRSISLTSKVPSEMASAAFIANTNTLAPMGAGIATINNSSSPSNVSAQEQFDTARINIGAMNMGPTTDNVVAMQAAIKRLYVGGSNAGGTTAGKESIPFPIDFSCTLDGIEGIVFGNTITCNYLPAAYQGDTKVAFTVTKVEHNIAGHDWTTTISTVCRFLPTF